MTRIIIGGVVALGVTACSGTTFSGGSRKATPPTEITQRDTALDQSKVTPASPAKDKDAGTDGKADFTPTSKNAVTKGSFTAWTLPANPKPFEDYKVIIRVKLPGNASASYGMDDLSGSVLGTDGWVQDIHRSISSDSLFPSKPQFKRDGAYAYVGLMVPGAELRVQDTIGISSRLLGESQTLTIVFQ